MAESCKILLDLGRHASPYAGLWVYGRTLAGGVDRIRSDIIPGSELFIRYGGSASLGGQLPRSIPIDQAKGSRRLGFVSDIFRAESKYEIVHGCANMVPILGNAGKRIVTIHDLLLAFPAGPRSRSPYQRFRNAFYRKLFASILKRVDATIAIHPSIASQILEHFPSAQIPRVIYSPLDPLIMGKRPAAISLRKNYLLSFAALDRRKNSIGAMRAFKEVASEVENLKIILSHPGLRKELENAADILGIERQVQFFVRPSAAELVELYSLARGVVFPSFAEGFGYPIYEAIALGTPVVAPESLTISELYGAIDKLIFECEPRSDNSIKEAVSTMLSTARSAEDINNVAAKVREVLDPDYIAKQILEVYLGIL